MRASETPHARELPETERIVAASAFRRSPVSFAARPAATEERDGWTVTLRYEGEAGHPGPFLVDLSHRRRWDCQDSRIATLRPMGLPVPQRVSEVGAHGSFVINRMNRTQVAIWELGQPSEPPPIAAAVPAALRQPGVGLTETTDGHCMLALVGAGVPQVLEHITQLDLFDPAREMPFLTQGPVLHVPCQVVTFSRDLVVMTLARGYGETFAAAVLDSGAIAGLRTGGEEGFRRVWRACGTQ